MEPQSAGAIGGGLFVLANVLLFWIREWLKQKALNANGKDLKIIRDDVKITNDKVDAVDNKVGQTTVKIAEIKTALSNQARQCKQTVNRFDETIRDHNQSIIDLSGRKR